MSIKLVNTHNPVKVYKGKTQYQHNGYAWLNIWVKGTQISGRRPLGPYRLFFIKLDENRRIIIIVYLIILMITVMMI